MSGGKLDLALQEFSDYLKWYGSTDLAPNAQYYIAYIHSSQGDYDDAVKEFDMVLEKYPDNNKTPDSLYNKGLALTKMGRRTDGAQEYRELIQRFPSNDLSKRACDQLKGMGLSCGARAATPPRAHQAHHQEAVSSSPCFSPRLGPRGALWAARPLHPGTVGARHAPPLEFRHFLRRQQRE